MYAIRSYYERITATIVETEPVVKGQTASGSYKPAILDNGVRVMVPTFIDAGTRIVITSYSIHYTKLYERDGPVSFAGGGGGQRILAP